MTNSPAHPGKSALKFMDSNVYCLESANYAAKHTSTVFSKEINDILEALAAETEKSRFPTFMMITFYEAQFLSELVQISGARNVLEIGTLTGYSAIAMASVLPEDGKLITLEIEPEAHAIANRYVKLAKLEDKIELRLAPAADSIAQIIKDDPPTQFDFIFVDADKGSYGKYLDMILDNNLLTDKGIIVVDNVLRGGYVARFANKSKQAQSANAEDPIDPMAPCLHAFNEKMVQDTRVHVTVLPLFDGLSIIRKK